MNHSDKRRRIQLHAHCFAWPKALCSRWEMPRWWPGNTSPPLQCWITSPALGRVAQGFRSLFQQPRDPPGCYFCSQYKLVLKQTTSLYPFCRNTNFIHFFFLLPTFFPCSKYSATPRALCSSLLPLTPSNPCLIHTARNVSLTFDSDSYPSPLLHSICFFFFCGNFATVFFRLHSVEVGRKPGSAGIQDWLYMWI